MTVDIANTVWPTFTEVGTSGDFESKEPNGPAPVDSFALNIDLTTAGRIGFYVDYSELATTGTHKFYVCRTHGTAGAVSVDYSSLGDSHTSVSGTLDWADGEADVRGPIEVVVPSKSAGDHRMYLQLSSPTGGAVLHDGTYTRAYGVIDDGTIAGDGDAVFYYSAASGGTGTQADPYDSIYTARDNVGSKRYIYGKGTTVPDGTNTANPNGGGGIVNCINFPATRTGESDRLYVRNWPGETWLVSGGGGNEEIGFYSDGGRDYISFKGIDFDGLHAWASVAGKFAEGGGISNHKAAAEGINVEHCTFNDIDGSTNTAGFNPYLINGSKVWFSTFNDVAVNGDNTHANSAGLLTYSGSNISVQECKVTNTHSGVYQKRVENIGDVSISARFNLFESEVGVLLGTAGGGNSHSYSIAQCNIFKGCFRAGIDHNNIFQESTLGEKHWWCGNVFDSCGGGEVAAINFQYAFSAQIFNNLFIDCAKVWADVIDRSGLKLPDVEYADYNQEIGTTNASQIYEYRGVNYTSAAALNAAFSTFAGNDTEINPLFTNAAINDYTLQALSTARLTGVSGVDKGAHWTGIEEPRK